MGARDSDKRLDLAPEHRTERLLAHEGQHFVGGAQVHRAPALESPADKARIAERGGPELPGAEAPALDKRRNALRHECGANRDNLKILKVRGNSMEPEMREGDRVVVDTARRQPAIGELFVLSDGTGVVVKPV